MPRNPAPPTERLLAWYDRHRRDLPWRRRPTAYRVWVSEIMLQQTQVDTVLPYYHWFLRRFPSLRSLALASVEEVLPLWSGLGYYRRARSLHAAARVIVERHGGRFPRDLETALSLPGVGPYTAAAVLSIAFGKPHAVLDGNVERVLTRILALGEDPARTAVKRRLRAQAQEWLPPDRAGDFNQALMELGALICSPTSPRCALCPLAPDCRARGEGNPVDYPVRAVRRRSEEVRLGALVLERGGRLLLERRDPGASAGPAYLRGLWTFPLEEIPAGSAVESVLSERLDRGHDGDLELAERLGAVRHSITFRRITLEAWRVHGQPSLEPSGADRERAWVRPEEFGETYAVPSLTRKIHALLGATPRPRRARKSPEKS